MARKVLVVPSFMASFARGAPLPGFDAPVAEPRFQELVHRSRSLTQKILLSIPDAHASCVHVQSLKLNSSDNAKLDIMASNIGIPPAPVVRAVSEDFTLETILTRMSEGLQQQRALLGAISEQLQNKNLVTELLADIRDLAIQINKMQKMIQKEAVVQPTPTPLVLRLQGEYEVQVAAHLTLVQLQAFGQDAVRCLRSLDQSNEEES